ncbi:MAG: LysR family transcriptional regulator [Pseudomonadota bacterium]
MIYPTIRHLRAFESVSRLGSFAHAAEELCISPSALSQNISQLEDILAAKLIDRTTRNMQLTSVGEQLYPRVLHWLSEMESTYEEISTKGQLSSGHVKIACLASVAINVLPSVLMAFRDTHPGVRISISDGNGAFVEDSVLGRNTDFGIAGGPIRSPDLTITPLFDEPYCVLCPQDHPLANRQKGVPWAELANYDFISLSSQTNIWQQLSGIGELSEVMPTPVHEVSQLVTLWGLVAKGFGISVLPRSACAEQPTYKILPLTNPPLTRGVGVITAKGRSLSPAAESFCTALYKAHSRSNKRSIV